MKTSNCLSIIQIYTTAGSELARVTVVSSDLKVVYEKLVKPEAMIIDCNTRYAII